MTDQEINEEIALACGWTHVGVREHFKSAGLLGVPPTASGLLHSVPDYCNDLNAMHEAEEAILKNDDLFHGYDAGMHHEVYPAWNASARQRAEAFVKTIGKWRTE